MKSPNYPLFYPDALRLAQPGCVSPPADAPRVSPAGQLATVLVIDTSGSMDSKDFLPTRLDGAKEAIRRFMDQILASRTNEWIGVVTFDSSGQVVCRPTPAKSGEAAIRSAVDGLQTRGTTMPTTGLLLAEREIAVLEGVRDPRILMLTDGHADSDDNPLATAQALKAKGIQLDIIGIGGTPQDVNEPELRQMASVVNGELRYWFIESVGELVRRFELLALREFK